MFAPHRGGTVAGVEEPLRRLAYTIEPAPSEHFSSWIRRAAFDLLLPPGRLAASLGLRDITGASDVRPRGLGICLSADTLHALRTTTGLPAATLRGMQLARYAPTLFQPPAPGESTTHWAQHNSVLAARSRGCPSCLAERPVWAVWWRLGAASCCPTHRVRLGDACPGGGHYLFRTSARAEGLTRRRLVDPARCGFRRGGQTCNYRWSDMVGVPVSSDEVRAMSTYLSAARGADQFCLGAAVPARLWIDAHRTLCFIAQRSDSPPPLPSALGAALSAHADQVRAGHRKPTVRQAPDAAALAGALNVVAHRILTADAVQAADMLAELADGVAGGKHVATTVAGRSQVLATLLGRRATVASVPVLPASLRGRLNWEGIPQTVPVVLLDPLFAELVPGTAAVTLRTFAALCVAKHVHGVSWADAGARLGLPAAAVRTATSRPVRQIADPDGLAGAVISLVAALRGANIDFAARRHRMAGIDAVPHSVLKDAGFGVVTAARRNHAAAWLWTEWAGGHPDTFAWPHARHATFGEGRRLFVAKLTTAQAHALTGWADAHVEAGRR